MTGILRDALTKEIECREKVNALATNAPDVDRSAATKALDDASIETRAALKAEPIEPLVADDPTDPETRERLILTKKARVCDIVSAFVEGTPVEGATAECRSAFGMTGYEIPHVLFEPRRPVETRAATPAPTDVPAEASPTQPLIYSRGLSSFLGVDLVPVANGAHIFPALTTGTPAGMKTKGSAADETATAFTADAQKPKRATGSFRVRYEDLAVFPQMEDVLRLDIPRSLANVVDQQVVAGSGSGGQLASLVSQLTAATVEATRDTLVTHIQKVAGLIDGRYAGELSDIRQAVGLATFKDAAALFSTTDSETAESWLSRRTGGLRGAPVAWLAAPVSNKQAGLARRGMQSMSAASALWGGVRLIRDELSSAQSGEVVVTALQLLSDVVLVHPGAFKATSFKLT